MNRIRFGLIARIALLVVCIEIAAFSVLGWFYIDQFSTAAEDRIRSRLHLVGQMIARDELPVSAISHQALVSDLVGAPYLNGMVIGGSGRVIVSTDPAYLGRSASSIPGFDLRLLADSAADEQIIVHPGRLTGVSHIHGPLSGSSLYYIVVTISTEELEAQKHSIALWGEVVSAVFILFSSAGIILVAQRLITRRVNTSLAVLEEVADGALDARIPVFSDDELGQLQRGINAMATKLGGLLKQHRRNEEEIIAILDSIADGVIAVGADGNVLRCNPSAASFLGDHSGAPVTGDIVTLLPELSQQKDLRWWCAPESLTAQGRLYFERRKADGGLRSMELGHGPICDTDGSVVGAVLVLQDITARRRAEEELHHAVERLTVSNAELERFAYVASHDLQEPLRTIVSFTQLLERRMGEALSAQDRESFNFVIEAAKRMSMLIKDLLAYSRVNKRDVQFSSVSLRQACASALDNLHEAIVESGAEVLVGELPDVVGDGVQLMQLFQNLMSNAIKFRRADQRPRVTVSAAQDGAEWIISVADNGIGIAGTDQDIFEIFRRLHAVSSFPGSGVGLAISKRIVQRHSGRIWFDTRLGEGTTFHFALPIIAGPSPA